MNKKRALVTGGAGLIGSHVVDLLVREGWKVRILDNLEPQTHRRGKPAWINPEAEFVEGDLRDRETITAALEGIDVVFHQAAYGGYMPEIAKYVHVNSLGTAQMLEVIRENKLPVSKIIVASSQAVYSEGAATCPDHGLVFPTVRPVEQLRSRRLGGSLPGLRCGHAKRADPGARTGRRRNRLWPNESRPGKTGSAVGKTNRHSDRCLALFLHLWTAPIDLQSLHRSDRDFLHAAAQ